MKEMTGKDWARLEKLVPQCGLDPISAKVLIGAKQYNQDRNFSHSLALIRDKEAKRLLLNEIIMTQEQHASIGTNPSHGEFSKMVPHMDFIYGDLNGWRLDMSRFNKAIMSCLIAAKSAGVDKVNQQVGGVSSVVGWAFYLPRLLYLLSVTVGHSIKANKGEGFRNASAYIAKNKFKIINDTTWITAGLVNCFALASLPVVGAFVTAGLYLVDTAMTYRKCQSEIDDLRKIVRKLNNPPQSLCALESKGSSFSVSTISDENVELISRIEDKIAELEYVKQYKLKLGLSMTMMMVGGAIAVLCSNPVTIAVVASVITLTCAFNYFYKKNVMPVKIIKTAKNKQALLKETLEDFLGNEIFRMKNYDQGHYLDKRNEFIGLLGELRKVNVKSTNTEQTKQDSDQKLQSLVAKIQAASRRSRCRGYSQSTRSAKALEKILWKFRKAKVVQSDIERVKAVSSKSDLMVEKLNCYLDQQILRMDKKRKSVAKGSATEVHYSNKIDKYTQCQSKLKPGSDLTKQVIIGVIKEIKKISEIKLSARSRGGSQSSKDLKRVLKPFFSVRHENRLHCRSSAEVVRSAASRGA